MNTIQLMNPDLVISNKLARFIKKWGFIRMPNQYDNFPRFLKAARNNVFELVFANWPEEKAEFCNLIYVNGVGYHIENEKVIKALKESR